MRVSKKINISLENFRLVPVRGGCDDELWKQSQQIGIINNCKTEQNKLKEYHDIYT